MTTGLLRRQSVCAADKREESLGVIWVSFQGLVPHTKRHSTHVLFHACVLLVPRDFVVPSQRLQSSLCLAPLPFTRQHKLNRPLWPMHPTPDTDPSK